MRLGRTFIFTLFLLLLLFVSVLVTCTFAFFALFILVTHIRAIRFRVLVSVGIKAQTKKLA